MKIIIGHWKAYYGLVEMMSHGIGIRKKIQQFSYLSYSSGWKTYYGLEINWNMPELWD